MRLGFFLRASAGFESQPMISRLESGQTSSGEGGVSQLLLNNHDLHFRPLTTVDITPL